MSPHSLDPIFRPKRIALIGVSINPSSVSGKVFGNLIGGGFKGVVYPVNETSEAVMGVPCYPDLGSLPRLPDLAVVCTAAEQVPGWVDQCGKSGIKGIIIMSAGFRESGETGRRLEEEIQTIRLKYPGMRIMGPNCLGIIVPELNLNLSFAPQLPPRGHIAFISQSGALCSSVLDWALEEKIGFSAFISIGNTLDVDFGHLIDYLGNDEATHSIILYVESICNARKFISAARAFARSKPILVYKAGRFPESAAVAASHTGALAAEDAIYDAVFARTGLTRVFDIGEIFDCAELIGRGKIPQGSRLGVVTNAGGPGVMASDALISAGGKLAELSQETIAALDETLPPIWSHGNPVDVLGDDRFKRLAKATAAVLKDPGVDAILVILTPQAMTEIAAAARAVAELQKETPKPILAAWLGGKRMREGLSILSEAGVAAYKTPEQAVRAFMTLVAYSRNLKTLYETPRDMPVNFAVDRPRIREQFTARLPGEKAVLSESLSKELLAAYHIPVSRPIPAGTADSAAETAARIGYPVVMKIDSRDITHKSDVGGVRIGIGNDQEARAAFSAIMSRVAVTAPSARINGVTVQPMIRFDDSLELILGIKKDPVFGTVLLAGAGGVGAELFCDRSLGLPPLNERLARRMLEELRIWPLLNGYRGKPPVDLNRLIEIIIRLSYLAADYPEIEELDINPLLVSPNAVMALDARIVIGAPLPQRHRFDHLAIVPYPEEYVRAPIDIDGTPVVFRPIRPEDEEMWFELLRSCSRESIYSRFNHFFNWESHEVAVRFCYVDYDREIAIVAEIEEEGRKKLIGVGRLISDPEDQTVEYAVLITDKWQNHELGSRLTDYCLDISRRWGRRQFIAQTTSDNVRIISLFRKRGFSIEHDQKTSTVFFRAPLADS